MLAGISLDPALDHRTDERGRLLEPLQRVRSPFKFGCRGRPGGSARSEAHLGHHGRKRTAAGLLFPFGRAGCRGLWLLAVVLFEIVGHLGLALAFPAEPATS